MMSLQFVFLALTFHWGQTSEVKTIVILGESGVGKSSLGNVLLGRDKNFAGYTFGCFKASSAIGSTGPTTSKPCMEFNHFLGDKTLPQVRIVDTPGFGFDPLIENRTLYRLSKFLQVSVKSTNVFLVLFKGNDYRFSRTLESLQMLNGMFGLNFWNHVVIGVTHWNYASHNIVRRLQSTPSMTEKLWTSEMNFFLARHFSTKSLPSVFIDSFHNPKDANESRYFRINSNQLLQLISNATGEFHFDKIDPVQTEVGGLRQRLTQLEGEVRLKEDEVRRQVEYKKSVEKLLSDPKIRIKADPKSSPIDLMITAIASCLSTGILFVVLQCFERKCCARKCRDLGDGGQDSVETTSTMTASSTTMASDIRYCITNEVQQNSKTLDMSSNVSSFFPSCPASKLNESRDKSCCGQQSAEDQKEI